MTGTGRISRAYTGRNVRRYMAKAAAKAGLLGKETPYRLALANYPQYAYGVLAAAEEAAKLGHQEISVVEFGVGSGGGLLTLQAHAKAVSEMTGVRIRAFGFDGGTGLPAPTDYRDLPHVWQSGFYPMDVDWLHNQLDDAELILGDVADTAAKFAAAGHPPVGFISFDLDYWSSTVAAFDVFRSDPTVCLPRVWCYFDDIIGTVEDVGELRAIADFNAEDHGRRIRQPYGLRARLPFEPVWADNIVQAHLFDHPAYTQMLDESGATLRR